MRGPVSKTRTNANWVDIDVKFRDLLFDAANNPVLRDISNHLYHQTLRLWFITLSRGQWKEEVRAMHEEIILTIKAWKEKKSEPDRGHAP